MNYSQADLQQGYVYRWTCRVNGKMYIGSHNGSNPHYVGSGLLFSQAVTKYGLQNFVREILYIGSDFRNQEKQILQRLDVANDPMYYNLKNDALGVSLPGKQNPMHRSNGRVDSVETRAKKGWSRGKTRPDHAEAMRGPNNPMFGKSDHAYGLRRRAAETCGKTLEEIYGEEKASEMLSRMRQPLTRPHAWREVTCPHCGRSGRGPNMSRYHFNNCKTRSK